VGVDLRLWDRDGKPLAVLEGHTFRVDGALVMPDGRILSWSSRILRLWDGTGKLLAVLEGHTGSVGGALALPDGRILSWSGEKDKNWRDDNTLRIWDKNGKPLEVTRWTRVFSCFLKRERHIMAQTVFMGILI
jgi:WD40 repeat protein